MVSLDSLPAGHEPVRSSLHQILSILSNGEETSLKTWLLFSRDVTSEKRGANKEFPLMESQSLTEMLQHPHAGSDVVTSSGFGAASWVVSVLGTETDQNAHSLQMAQMLLKRLVCQVQV